MSLIIGYCKVSGGHELDLNVLKLRFVEFFNKIRNFQVFKYLTFVQFYGLSGRAILVRFDSMLMHGC